MEIYHDILIGLESESKTHSLVKRTRVQQESNLSYDKFSRHLNDMARRGLVVLSPLSITVKGREFVRDYNRIRVFMREMGAKYLETEPPLRNVALELVAGLPSMQHSVLLYEDRRYADLVAATFLSEGLARDESCVYLTFEDPEILEKRLSDVGLKVKEGIGENQFRIYPRYVKTQEKAISISEIKRLVEESTRGMSPPIRIFGDFVDLITPARRIQEQLLVEKLLHESFDGLGITMLCWYDVKKIPRTLRRKFVESIIERHNHVIFASDPSRAFGFDASLLGTED